MKNVLLTCITCFLTFSLSAQATKKQPKNQLPPGKEVNLNIHPFFKPALNLGEHPFGIQSIDFAPQVISPGVSVTMGDEGLPIFFEGQTNITEKASDVRSAESIALQYIVSLQPAGIQNPAAEFGIKKVQFDERSGNYHVKLQQQYKGVPVFGAELIAHTQKGMFTSANGRYAPTPNIETVLPAISAATAISKVVDHIGRDKVKANWTPDQLEVIGGQQFTSALVIYRVKTQDNKPRLAWQIKAYPNMLSQRSYFVDAQTGDVLHYYNASCTFHQHKDGQTNCDAHTSENEVNVPRKQDLMFGAAPPPPPVTGSGIDLEGNMQNFGAWQHTDNKRYLIDATKSMFIAAGSSIPNGTMKGVIATRNQNNVYDGPLSHITSTTNTFNDANAVSAHVNSAICYDYYLNTFNRNSIDGAGGSINVVVNVTDEDGAMDNAYWNGTAMFWGNGNTVFSPLAQSLDVAGHEMTHGVVENTAGLIYENESGALNESFSDIFGVMMDRDEWGIGDGIMLAGQSPTGLLRDLSDPHNGSSDGDDWWQPNHYSERSTGSEDNGGVHKNSGIPNFAFYKFATHPDVSKEVAEQVFYYTLRDRLTSSSRFIDLRLAVIAEATEYNTPEVVAAAKEAFDAVGITSGNPTATAPKLQPGTGNEYILSVTEDDQYLDLSEKDGTFITTLYEDGLLERPSVTDNGEQIVFVNADHQIMGIEIAYNSPTEIQYNVGVISQDTIWRNVAISKDGRFLAALTNFYDNKVVFFDLADPIGPTPREYFLVNPTFTQGTPWIDNVAWADVLEFDYSGQYLAYDALTVTESADGEDLSHWDIGLLKYRENGQYTSVDTPKIRKLITGLPDHVGVADPAFAKNSPNIIAFDYYVDLPNGGVEYSTYVANTETNKNGRVVANSKDLGYPCFTTKDDQLLFNDENLFGGLNLRIQKLKANHIEPTGNPTNIVLGHRWGVWLNNSTRVLTGSSSTTDFAAKMLPITVSPNPTTGITQINLTLTRSSAAKIQVLNVYGQLMMEQNMTTIAGENTLMLDVKPLAPGTYFVNLVTGEGRSMAKIVKQ